MEAEWTTAAPARDRRVRRSRAALMQAAITLVTERDSAAVPISDIADAADVSRQVLYQQFGDRDTLLLEAALDLARRELLPPVLGAPDTGRPAIVAMARHFAGHRRFYRALLTGSCAFALNKALMGLILPVNRRLIQDTHAGLDPRIVEDVATFLTGGAGVVVNTWVVEGPDPLDPEEFADRLMLMRGVLTAAITKESSP